MNGQHRERIYEIRERGTYRQFFIPRRGSTKQEKIEKQQRLYTPLAINYSTTPLKVLDALPFSAFMIQNLDVALELYLGFGFEPDVTNKIGLLVPSEQLLEPLYIPQNEIWVRGSGSGKAFLLYSLD